jgi:hypothetical protein
LLVEWFKAVADLIKVNQGKSNQIKPKKLKKAGQGQLKMQLPSL